MNKKIILILVLTFVVISMTACEENNSHNSSSSEALLFEDLKNASCESVGGICYDLSDDQSDDQFVYELLDSEEVLAMSYSCPEYEHVCFIQDDRPFISLTHAYAIIYNVAYFGFWLEDNIFDDLTVKSSEDDWLFESDKIMIVMNKKTGIQTCFDYGDELHCDNVFLTFYKNSIFGEHNDEYFCNRIGPVHSCPPDFDIAFQELKRQI